VTIDHVLQETRIPAVVADHRGMITEVNRRFEEVFGWRRREILGKPLTTLIPQVLHDAHHLGFSRFLMTGRPTLLERPLRLQAMAKDGHVFDAEHFIVAEQRQGHWVFAATIRPLDRPQPVDGVGND
jgi:PAS domain S-box-containing protein